MSRQSGTKVDIFAQMTARIEQVREQLGLSQSAFCRRIGFPYARYHHITGERRSKPSADLLSAVAAHTDVNPHWLLSGAGTPYLRPVGAVEPREAVAREAASREAVYREALPRAGAVREPAQRLDDAYVLLPLYGVHGGAGEGAVVNTEDVEDLLAFKREWITRELRSSPDDLSLIYVRGESMVPTLSPGDVILVERNHAATVSDGIYVIRMGEALLVKRLQFLPDGELMVTSDNAAYQTFRVSLKDGAEQFSIIGRVVWAGRRF
jgi:phage repressor protein C with HTH and peptisase S24 domain